MGNPIWYIFVGLVSVGIAWAIRKIQPVILQVFIAVIASAVLSVLLATVPELLQPSPPGEAAFGWTVILAATWAMVAIPTCLVAVLVFNRIQRRTQRTDKKQVYEGKVIDADTKQPIEGAVVTGSWTKRDLAGYGEYYDSNEILTDKNGEFRIPGKGLLVLSKIEEMNVSIFKAGYKQWTTNSWSGLKGKWPNDEATWEGNKGAFKLKRLTLDERRENSPNQPDGPAKKQRLWRIERNKEMVETSRPADTLLPVE